MEIEFLSAPDLQFEQKILKNVILSLIFYAFPPSLEKYHKYRLKTPILSK